MSEKQTGKERKLHGNNAKIDPSKHVESLYANNMAVIEGKTIRKGVKPEIRDDLAEYSRNFVNENKK